MAQSSKRHAVIGPGYVKTFATTTEAHDKARTLTDRSGQEHIVLEAVTVLCANPVPHRKDKGGEDEGTEG